MTRSSRSGGRRRSRAVVAMEVFIEEQIVAEVFVLLKFLRVAEDRTATLLIAQENARQAAGQFTSDLVDGDEWSRTAWDIRL